jgi:hypothetical protein
MRALACLLLALPLAVGCDHGLAPPPVPPAGAIRGIVVYVGHPDAWPPRDEVRDLRFVAMRFVPRDTADFLQLNRMVISETLRYRVPSDTFFIDDVAAGIFPFSGVAQHFSDDLLAWRPVGLYEGDGGLFEVRPGEVTEVSVTVDFKNPPRFPPD